MYSVTDQPQKALYVSLSRSTKDVRNVNVSQIQLVALREEALVWLALDIRSRPEVHAISCVHQRNVHSVNDGNVLWFVYC